MDRCGTARVVVGRTFRPAEPSGCVERPELSLSRSRSRRRKGLPSPSPSWVRLGGVGEAGGSTAWWRDGRFCGGALLPSSHARGHGRRQEAAVQDQGQGDRGAGGGAQRVPDGRSGLRVGQEEEGVDPAAGTLEQAVPEDRKVSLLVEQKKVETVKLKEYLAAVNTSLKEL